MVDFPGGKDFSIPDLTTAHKARLLPSIQSRLSRYLGTDQNDQSLAEYIIILLDEKTARPVLVSHLSDWLGDADAADCATWLFNEVFAVAKAPEGAEMDGDRDMRDRSRSRSPVRGRRRHAGDRDRQWRGDDEWGRREQQRFAAAERQGDLRDLTVTVPAPGRRDRRGGRRHDRASIFDGRVVDPSTGRPLSAIPPPQSIDNYDPAAPPRPDCSVLIKGVAPGATNAIIRSHFSVCGPVPRVSILKRPISGEPSHLAWVSFKTAGAAQRALQLSGSVMLLEPIQVYPKESEEARAEVAAMNEESFGAAMAMAAAAMPDPRTMAAMVGWGGRGRGRGRGRGGRSWRYVRQQEGGTDQDAVMDDAGDGGAGMDQMGAAAGEGGAGEGAEAAALA